MIRLNVILSDYLGRVLLMSDPQVNKLSLPSAHLTPGTPPADTLAGSVRLTTGIIAQPVRLTGIYADSDGLMLSFRAVQRGGAIATADNEQPVAGFFNATPLPQPMTAATRQILQDAMRHRGGPPVSATAAKSMGERLRGALGTGSPETAAYKWDVIVTLVCLDPTGKVLWRKEPGAKWLRLPSAAVPAGSLPGMVARKLAHATVGSTGEPLLSGIYLHRQEPVIEFCYRDGMMDASNDTALMTLQGDLSDYDPGHVQQAQQALRGDDELDFAILPKASATTEGSADYG